MAKLFTPGPLNTSDSVKKCMLVDVGSRDLNFIDSVANMRRTLVDLADGDQRDYTTVPLQGSGSFVLEAVLLNALGNNSGKGLIISNGAYGDRLVAMSRQAKLKHSVMRFPEVAEYDFQAIEEELKADNYSLIFATHCETSTGQFNDIETLGKLIRFVSPDSTFAVDAMSSFGAVPLSVSNMSIDILVSSANKCLQGVPGFSFVVCRRDLLECFKGRCPSWSFDLVAQYEGLERNGQFRCTPATHTILAFEQALKEFEAEGGVQGRRKRYVENNRIIRAEMSRLGFRTLLSDNSAYIITSFLYPSDPNFDFDQFYRRLSARSQVIYPGKVGGADSFRLGNIGDLAPNDCKVLMKHLTEVLTELDVALPVTYSD